MIYFSHQYLSTRKVARKTQCGATLIETMVSLFIMGVGLMGVLAMQTQSMRFNSQAYSYSQAVFLAQDILESMRANRENANSYILEKGKTVSSSVDCDQRSCDPQQLAQWDLQQWLNNVGQRLPGGEASISHNNGTFTINLEFDMIRTNEEMTLSSTDLTRQNYTLNTGL